MKTKPWNPEEEQQQQETCVALVAFVLAQKMQLN